MRLLIVGGSGCLGHTLWKELSKRHEVWATLRADKLPSEAGLPLSQAITPIDVRDKDAIKRALDIAQPEVVLNCAGIVSQVYPAQLDEPIAVNALFPHKLVQYSQYHEARVVHISTDCVFDGDPERGGNYTEADPEHPPNHYGWTKYLGELLPSEGLTLRLSFIGPELRSKHGLLEWFLASTGEVNGYSNAWWTGITTFEVASVIDNFVLPNPQLKGLYHVAGPRINKYDLLMGLKRAFNREDIGIVPVDEPSIDRSLDGSHFNKETGFQPITWDVMLKDLAERMS